jgi:hypothetical protein
MRFDRETAGLSAVAWFPGSSQVQLSGVITALADDLIQDVTGRLWRVTANVTGSAVPAVQVMGTSGVTFPNGSVVVYRSLRCSVTIGFLEPSALQKRWGRITSAWTQLVGAPVLRHAFQSSESPTSVEEDADLRKRVNGFAVHTYGYAQSWPVPNAHARAWAIRASTKWLHAHGGARLEGIGLVTEPMEDSSPPEVAP